MAYLVELKDFKGEFSIVANAYTEEDHQVYLDKYERIYLIRLLGAELYKLLIADLNTSGVPQSTRFLNIYNPFEIDKNCQVWVSEGLKQMIIAFVSYHIIRDSDYLKTLAGNTSNVSDNSEKISQVKAKVWEYFNKGVDTVWAIQWFICDNKADYPEFNGQNFDKISWL